MNREEYLAEELKILKEALAFAQANDKLGVIAKFVELCAYQEKVLEEEAYDVTTQVIRNAQRNARCEVQSRHDASIETKPNQKDHQGKES